MQGDRSTRTRRRAHRELRTDLLRALLHAQKPLPSTARVPLAFREAFDVDPPQTVVFDQATEGRHLPNLGKFNLKQKHFVKQVDFPF